MQPSHMRASAQSRKALAVYPSEEAIASDRAPGVLIDWREIIAAIQDKNADIAFPELSDLLHACLTKLQGSINAEIYQAVALRAKNRGIRSIDVDMRV